MMLQTLPTQVKIKTEIKILQLIRNYFFRFHLLPVIVSILIELLQLLCRSAESRSKGLQAVRSRVVVGPSVVPEHHEESVKREAALLSK